jgi:putative DNA primase/helicase
MTNTDLDALALSPEFSEDRLALNFTDKVEHSLRYVATLGKWFIWDGARWRIDDTQLARDRVRAVCRDHSSQCNESRQAKLIASAKTVSAVERLASTDRRIAATIAQFDSDAWLLNTPGETIDLRTGESREHAPGDYITKVTGTSPGEGMATPIWNEFLDRITGGNTDLILFLRRMAGYSLTGLTIEHALFFLYGTGICAPRHRPMPALTKTATNVKGRPLAPSPRPTATSLWRSSTMQP